MENIEKKLEEIINGKNFTKKQIEQIRLGLEKGIDVSVYADPKFDWEQMWQIREGLEEGLDVSVYADPNLTAKEMEKIRIREELEQQKKNKTNRGPGM